MVAEATALATQVALPWTMVRHGIDVLNRDSIAIYSPDEAYRYALVRRAFDYTTGTGERRSAAHVWIMLNPSTATEAQDDPTVHRCMARSFGARARTVTILNLFAFRATQPRALHKAADPVGPCNDDLIARYTEQATHVICAWGSFKSPRKAERVERVMQIVRASSAEVICLGTNQDGAPKHPLYIPTVQPFEAYQ